MTLDEAGIRTLDELKSLSAEQLQSLLRAEGLAQQAQWQQTIVRPICEAPARRITVKSLPRRAACAAGEDCDGAGQRSR